MIRIAALAVISATLAACGSGPMMSRSGEASTTSRMGAGPHQGEPVQGLGTPGSPIQSSPDNWGVSSPNGVDTLP